MPKPRVEHATGLIAFSADEITPEKFKIQVEDYRQKLEEDGYSYQIEMTSETSVIFKHVTKTSDENEQ